jgi:hypothetical protein
VSGNCLKYGNRLTANDKTGLCTNTTNMIWETCVGLKASTEPCNQREDWCPVSCLTKLKNELHGQCRMSIKVGMFIKGNNENSCGKGGLLSRLPEK